jgi:hypothetical protein
LIARLSDGAKVTRQAVNLYALANPGLVRESRHGREWIWALHTSKGDQMDAAFVARALMRAVSLPRRVPAVQIWAPPSPGLEL